MPTLEDRMDAIEERVDELIAVNNARLALAQSIYAEDLTRELKVRQHDATNAQLECLARLRPIQSLGDIDE